MKLIVLLEDGGTGKILDSVISDSIYVESRVNDKEKHEVL